MVVWDGIRMSMEAWGHCRAAARDTVFWYQLCAAARWHLGQANHLRSAVLFYFCLYLAAANTAGTPASVSSARISPSSFTRTLYRQGDSRRCVALQIS